MKRVVILSDLHSGHQVGLTPPEYDAIPEKCNAKTIEELELDKGRAEKYYVARLAAYKARRDMWNFFVTKIKSLLPIHALIVNGDMVDGDGWRSGGEHITTDRTIQTNMAAHTILQCGAKQVHGTYGTAYHTGESEDWEDEVANKCGMKTLKSHQWIEVEGTIFDCKHHCASSGIPTGRHGAVAKERLWNMMWAEFGEDPKADVYIRSHVHYHNFCGGPNWLGMTTPPLQGKGSKYGARRCSGTVDFGLVHFDVKGKRDYSWAAHVARLKSQFSQVVKV